MSTIMDSVVGTVIGNLYGAEDLYLPNKSDKEVINANKYFGDDVVYQAQRRVCSSIRKNKEINLKHIFKSLNDLDTTKLDPNDGSILCWIFPFGFWTSYEHDDISMSDAVSYIVNATHSDEVVDTCIEYTRLIHDIFWNYASPESILKMFPKLITPKETIHASRTDIKSVMTAALWSFGHSVDFNDALINASTLKPSTPWVSCVTGTLAGLYYGIDDTSNTYIIKTGAEPFIDDLMFS